VSSHQPHFEALFAIAALAAFCWEFGRLWFAMRSEFWPYVMGTIEEVEIDNRRDSDSADFFVPRIRYTYRVAGEDYSGKRLAFRPKGSYSYQAVVAALDGVIAAKTHRVYYHPQHPRLSVLKPGPRLLNYIVLLILFAVICFVFYVHTTTS
jgi:uncharacterized protein DUF3592